MMDEKANEAETILARTQYTETIGGVTYVLRRLSGPIAFKIRGTKIFGVVRGAIEADRKSDDGVSEQRLYELAPAYLAECMVRPRLAPAGEPSDTPNNVVAFEDLGDDALDLFVSILKSGGAGRQLRDFSESSVGKTDGTSPEDYTQSEVTTDNFQASLSE